MPCNNIIAMPNCMVHGCDGFDLERVREFVTVFVLAFLPEFQTFLNKR